MIFTSLTPNIQKDDIILYITLLFQPWKWNVQSNILSEKFTSIVGTQSTIIALDSARSSLYIALKSLHLSSDDEVILQAFTCVAVVNPILWAGAKPIFIDCEQNSYNMDLDDLKSKITSRTKVIIVQHTFGIPAKLDEIITIARKQNIFVIEDCAHTISGLYNNSILGTTSDMSIFSFGRDKSLSCTSGGILVVNNSQLVSNVEKNIMELNTAPRLWTLKNLLHPIIMQVIKSTYNSAKIGRLIFRLALALNILPKAIEDLEKHGSKPDYMPSLLPYPLQKIATHQLSKLNQYNSHRISLASLYKKLLNQSQYIQVFDSTNECANPLIRYPIQVHDARKWYEYMKTKNIELGRWYDAVIIPKDIDYSKINYEKGSCPRAEQLALSTINLPLSINVSSHDANMIINTLNAYISQL